MNFFSLLKNNITTSYKLAKDGYKDFGTKYTIKQQAKIIPLSIIYPFFTSRWFAFLKSDEFKNIFKYKPRIYIKPYRPYMCIKWNRDKKIKVILDSYKFIHQNKHIFGNLIEQDQPITIAKLSFENTSDVLIKIGYDHKFRKEGELLLSIECEDLGGKLSCLAFSFEEIKNGDYRCIVGSVQSYNHPNIENGFKKIQNILHRMRPTALIAYVFADFARELGTKEILCVGDAIHTYRRKHGIPIPFVYKISFDYDSFWLEVGASKIDDEWFSLPLKQKRKPLEEIASKKRSMYRKRYAMLDDLSNIIKNKLNKKA